MQHTAAVLPLLALVCALWLGLGSVAGAKQLQHIYSRDDTPSKTFTLALSGGLPLGKCNHSCPSGGTYQNLSFACSGGPASHAGKWTNVFSFKDPLVNSSVVVGVKVELVGRFNCAKKSVGDALSVSIQSTVVNVSRRMPAYPSGCDCPQCFTSAVFQSSGSIDGYQYGGLNEVLVSTLEPASQNYICLAQLEVTLFYFLAEPLVYDILPNAGPCEEPTLVKIWGQDFDPRVGLNCLWGSKQAEPQPAVWLSAEFVLCNTSVTQSPGDVEFFMQVVATNEIYDCGQQFTFYKSPNVTGLNPSSGPADGGNNVSVLGNGFLNLEGSPLLCLLGEKKISGTFVSESKINCTDIPPGSGTVSLQISLNGQQYVGDLKYVYTASARKSSSKTGPIPGWALISGFFGICTVVAGIAVFVTKRYRALAEGNRSSYLKDNMGSESTSLLSPGRGFDVTKQIDISDVNIRERIGKGTFGEVYRGLWRGTDVAVKFLTAGFGNDAVQDEEFLAEFDREVTIMRCCRHPNVLQFLGACAAPPNVCIVMEFMPRGSLFGLLHDPKMESRVTLCRLRRMLVDAARGMNYLHKSTPVIIHRDLKSHNLLVDENFKVKVCDFGLSKILETQADVASLTACGTPSWTAPEILRNEQYSEAADIYSYGVVLWECVTRQDPYEGMPPFQVVLAVGTRGMRPPLADGDYHPQWTQLIRECWAENPDTRPSFDDIMVKLDYLDDGEERPPREKQSVSSSSETERERDTHSSFSPPLQATPRVLFRDSEVDGNPPNHVEIL